MRNIVALHGGLFMNRAWNYRRLVSSLAVLVFSCPFARAQQAPNAAGQGLPTLPAMDKNAAIRPVPVVKMPALKAGKVPNRSIKVTQGLARFLSFRSNVLSLALSDQSVLGLSAMNSRTVAITGTATGKARIAVYTSRYRGDVVGEPSVFEVEVEVRDITKVQLDTARLLELLGRQWSQGTMSFEEMLVEEIEKRDQRIQELERQPAAK